MENDTYEQDEDAIDTIINEDEMTLATADTTTFIPRGRMLTLNEAAEYLGIQADTLRQQAGRGVLRAEKRGRDWLVSPLEVERYAAHHRRTR